LIHSGSSSSFDRRTDERAAEMSAKSISEADKSCNMRMGLCHSISAPSDAEDVKSPLNYGRYSITVAGFWGVLNWLSSEQLAKLYTKAHRQKGGKASHRTSPAARRSGRQEAVISLNAGDCLFIEILALWFRVFVTALEVNADVRLITYYPGIMPRRNRRHLTWPDLRF